MKKIFYLFFISMFFYSGYNLMITSIEYKKAKDEYEEISERAILKNPELKFISDKETSLEKLFTEKNLKPFNIDFEYLKSINTDTIGWIFIPFLKINYPIVQGKDNEHYLTYTFNHSKNKSGAIFLDHQNKADLSDTKNIIYGHNMKDGSMFGKLKRIKKGEIFIINTPKSKYAYKVSKIFKVKETDDIFTFFSKGFEKEVLLVTCTKESEKRLVVRAVQES